MVSFIGKLFVVLLTVACLVFGTFAVMIYATHQDWRGMVDNATEAPGKPLGLRPQLEKLEQQNRDLSNELSLINEEISAAKKARQERLSELEHARVGHEQKLADFLKQRADLAQIAEDQGKKMQELQKTIVDKKALLKKIQDDRDAALAARDAAFNKARQQTVEVNFSQVELDRLKTRSEPLSKQLEKLKEITAGAP